MLFLGYLFSGLMGLSLGLIGGGGSILTVPILVYFFSIDPLIATSESLFVVGSTALVGGVLAFLNKEVNLVTVIKFALASFIGVLIMKKFILSSIPDVIFQTGNFSFTKSLFVMIIFAVLMLIVSVSMIKSKNTSKESVHSQKDQTLKLVMQGIFVGNVTGLVGAGGGFLIVPALVNLVGLNMRSAIGSSLLIIAANSLFGFSVAVSSGLEVHWQTLFSIMSISLVGLFVGRIFSKKVPEAHLKTGFGYFVLVMGSLILLDQILKFKL